MFKSKKHKKTTTNKKKLIVDHTPKSPVSEQFRGIRTNISFSNVNDDLTSVVITSARPSSGKSTVSANLAITYAQSNYRTLIIDADMRKPTQHFIFELSNKEGLSSLLSGQSSGDIAIKQTHIDNLDVLTSGPVPPNPSEMLNSKAFRNVFESAQEVYDFIVIDTPPVNSVTDSQLVAKVSKQVVLVIDVNNNNRKEIQRAKDLLEKSGANLLGVVLNKLKGKSDEYYAYYGAEER
ncbi:capsular biosynthesis protein [Staphylococcus hyicus]|uniref:polysaccharide biosynthesis tyrosine autokinase n=1 Tax=Staphylococcus hyicus TaxID=1284 RepID=UPI000D1E3D28|nr:polysaccharide biosynthesis tyrosine autokinase [Staphylococcus hyicus]PTJ72575.1 capsular biosynthesis protein [Staphylococcus hyicus]PTJ86150.1 capsular biosynthesis protein [Staphylococcus hyicus]